MAFWRRRGVTNKEVDDAVAERDAVLAAVEGVVKKVDDLKDELLREYRRANGLAPPTAEEIRDARDDTAH